jgi:hypothetical protein
MTVEIHSVNQILVSKTSSEHSQRYVTRQLSAHCSLSDLKREISHDISQGMQQAFPLPASSSSAALLMTQDREYAGLLELDLQYFHTSAEAWRPLLNEVDWMQAKHNCCTALDHSNSSEMNMKVLYNLSAKSEQLLLKRITLSYEARQKELQQERSHFSVQQLTEALTRGGTRHSCFHPDNIPPVKTVATVVTANSTTKRKQLMTVHKSLLYPARSEGLDAMQRDREQSQPRLQALADNLEAKLLKTRW